MEGLFQIETTNSFLLSEIIKIIKSNPGEGEVSSSPFTLGINRFQIDVEYEDTFHGSDSHIGNVGIRYMSGEYPHSVFHDLISQFFPNHAAQQGPTYIVNIEQDQYRLEKELDDFMRFAERPHLFRRDISTKASNAKIPTDELRITMEKLSWKTMSSVATTITDLLMADIEIVNQEQADGFTNTPTRKIEVGNEKYIFFATLYKSAGASYNTYLIRVVGIFQDTQWQGTLYEHFIKVRFGEDLTSDHREEILNGITEKLDNVHDEGTLAKLAWREHPYGAWVRYIKDNILEVVKNRIIYANDIVSIKTRGSGTLDIEISYEENRHFSKYDFNYYLYNNFLDIIDDLRNKVDIFDYEYNVDDGVIYISLLPPRDVSPVYASQNTSKPDSLKSKMKEVSLHKGEDGYFVATHRARSDSYETPEAIPDKDIEFISSTGFIIRGGAGHEGLVSNLKLM